MDERLFTGSRPLVSVVIPTFNRARVLPRAVRSVLAQSFQDFEIHVVDDASTDGSDKVVGDFADPRLNLLQLSTRAGAAVARNAGIESARGKYVAFLDSDDEYLPSFLEALVGHMEAAPSDEVAVLPSFYHARIDGTRGETHYLSTPQYWELLRFKQATRPFIMVRADALSRVHFDPELVSYQEWDLFMQLLHEYRIAALTTPEVIVHDERDSMKVTSPWNHIEALGYLSRKYAASLARDTFAQRQWHMKLMRLHMDIGQVQRARSRARRAALAYPRHVPTWGLFLPARMNDRVFTWAWNAYRTSRRGGAELQMPKRGSDATLALEAMLRPAKRH